MTYSQAYAPDSRHLRDVRRFVCESAGIELSHPAVLVVSELATNAVLHARTPFTVNVGLDGVIRLEVRDDCPDLPVAGSGRLGGGHGLSVVEEFSECWGTELSGDGKVVWAEVGWEPILEE